MLALALALADLAGQWLSQPASAGQPPGTTLPGVHGQPGTTAPAYHAHLQSVSPAVLSLFGQAGNSEFTLTLEEEIRETELDLTLKGVLAERKTNRKLVLIAQAGDMEKVYWLGDRIADAEIIGIAPRRAILLRNGAREALTLKTEKPASPAETGRVASHRGSKGITRINERERVVTRELIDRQLENLPDLLRQAKVVPYVDNGQKAGFRVVNIEAESVFEDLGLRQGDIIVAVNGVSVRDTREALAAYRSFKSATTLQVDLLRGDRQVALDFSIQ